MALELAEDRRHGEDENAVVRSGSKRSIAFSRPSEATWIEVVERLAAALVAPRELAGEREEAFDERLARRDVTVAVVALEQPPILAGTGRTVIRRICSACASLPMFRRLHAFPDRESSKRRGQGRGNAAAGVLGPQPGPV